MTCIAPSPSRKRKTRNFQDEELTLCSNKPKLLSRFDEEQLKFYSNEGPARKTERSAGQLSLVAQYAKKDAMLTWIDSFRPRCVALMKKFWDSFLRIHMHVDIFCSAVHLFDAYVASPDTVLQHTPFKDFKLAALVAFWVSAKVNKTDPTGKAHCKVRDIKRISNYDDEEIFKAEREFLRRIGYRCTQPSAAHFLKDYLREYFGPDRPKSFDGALRIARHKLEKVLEDRVFFFTAPSKIAYAIARYSIEMHEDKSIQDDERFHAFTGYDANCYEDIKFSSRVS